MADRDLTVLVDRLVADARPVRRLWPLRWRVAAWAAVVLGGVGVVGVVAGRLDLAERLSTPAYVVELAAWVGAAMLMGMAALGSAVPGLSVGARALAALGSVGIAVGTALVTTTTDATITLAAFGRAMNRCAIDTTFAGVLPWVVLAVAQHRGAPLERWRSAAFSASAAWLTAMAVMRMRCPSEDLLHLALAHGAPALVAGLVGTFVATRLMRRDD